MKENLSEQISRLTSKDGLTHIIGQEALHDVKADYATIGDNPYKEQKNRLKKAIKQVELAQEDLARMGSVYVSGGHEERSGYCQALYIALEAVHSGMKTFVGYM